MISKVIQACCQRTTHSKLNTLFPESNLNCLVIMSSLAPIQDNTFDKDMESEFAVLVGSKT